jgi:hypothetical protein
MDVDELVKHHVQRDSVRVIFDFLRKNGGGAG